MSVCKPPVLRFAMLCLALLCCRKPTETALCRSLYLQRMLEDLKVTWLTDWVPAGLCDNDINSFCPKVKPGELRLSQCLSNQFEEEEKGNVQGEQCLDCWVKAAIDAL